MRKIAFIFPGSGSQYPGMAARLIKTSSRAREVFEEASDVLGWDLVALCTKGGLIKLNKTKFLFPALHVTNIAHFHVAMQECGCKPSVMLGHSLGEYSALHCAGAISLADSVRIVEKRAEIAVKAQQASVTGTTILKNTSIEVVQRIIEQHHAENESALNLACINSDSQFMLTGDAKAILAAEQTLLQQDAGAEVIPIIGGAPYHSSLMTPYVPALREVLHSATFYKPSIPVISSATTRLIDTSEDIKLALTQQLDHTVLWRDCIETLKRDEVSVVVEMGPQSVLKNLLLEVDYPGQVLAHDDKADREALGGLKVEASNQNKPQTIMATIEKSLKRNAREIAVRSNEGTLTYAELDHKSALLAHQLRDIGVGPDVPVAVGLTRSPMMIVAIFAILRAGGAYLPLNMHHPSGRNHAILKDSQTACLISDTVSLKHFEFDGQTVLTDMFNWDAPLPNKALPIIQPEDLAYIIYTSGSTGRPKGVCTEHAALNNRLNWMQDAYPIDSSDTILQKTVSTFDVSLWELLWWAMQGASVALLPSGKEQDPRAISRAIRAFHVSVVHFVPSVFELFVTYEEIKAVPEELANMRYVFLSGEKLPSEIVQRFYALCAPLPELLLVNLYGPTEAAIDVTYFNCPRDQCLPDIPIGEAINGIELHIVDEQLNPTDDEGELLICGAGLARGYLNAPELTDASFITVPALGGVRAYRSGDLVKRNPQTGLIHYIGRRDFQIKLRGLRVELEEIEHALLACEGVSHACVFADTEVPSSHYIFAAIVCNNDFQDGKVLMANLSDQLPEYMLPSRTLLIESIPLSDNGKLDRKALLAIAKGVQGELVDLRQPVTEIDMQPQGDTEIASFNLSSAQHAMWIAQQLHPERSLFSSPILMHLSGELDVARLARAVDYVVQLHPQLRVGISAEQAIQIADQAQPCLEVVGPWPSDRPLSTPIPFAQGRYSLERELVRFALWEMPDGDHILQIDLDHILCDGWSKAILVEDLLAHYRAEPTKASSKDFITYASQLQNETQTDKYQGHLSYWKERLADPLPVLNLPFDRKRPLESAHQGSLISFSLPASVVERLRKKANQKRTTLYTLLLAAYALFLNRHTGQNDLIVGIPLAGRLEADFERTFGLLVNSLPLRLSIEANDSFDDLLSQVKKATLALFRHSKVPFEDIVKQIKPQRQGSAFPVYQTTFQLDSLPVPDMNLSDLKVDVLLNDTGVSLLDLSVSLHETEDGLKGTFEFDVELFDQVTIERFVERYCRLLENIAQSDDRQYCSDLSLLCNQDLAAYRKLNGKGLNHQPAVSLWARLEQALTMKGQHICVKETTGDFATGLELLGTVKQLAKQLALDGINPGDRVAIVMHAGLPSVVAQLAVCCIGGEWMPIDPQLPKERLISILNTAKPLRILLDERSADLFYDDKAAVDGFMWQVLGDWKALAQSCSIGHDWQVPEVSVAQDAVILFTSGTTGQPKGVRLTHSSLSILIDSFLTTYKVTQDDVLLPITSVGSASYLGEILPILVGGGCLLLADQRAAIDTRCLLEIITQESVSILSSVPAFLSRLNRAVATMDGIDLSRLSWILCGGEALASDQIDHLVEKAQIVNGYGLTEATICSTCHIVTKSDVQTGGIIPIGKALAGTDLSIVDEHGNNVPVGVAGELHISGTGLAAGYLDERQTAARFVECVHGSGKRYLRTGDRVQMRPDGCLIYLGRVDRQVQIRGHRVELSDIESRMSTHPEVEVVHIQLKDLSISGAGTPILVAYYTTKAQVPVAESDLRAFLARQLPAYMIPNSYLHLENMPLNLNGKVDEEQLPHSDFILQSLSAKQANPPQTAIEQKLAGIWAELLGGLQASVDVNFFDVGGNSLLLSDLQQSIERTFDHTVALLDLFENTTIRSQADFIQRASQPKPADQYQTQCHTARLAFHPDRWKLTTESQKGEKR
ncbi:amino acid adenylation domain-containing protein [Vibrio harveyi]|uniref:non-ribosomal peptide synthetase n=1 Tax=Vibrio harveyi TaxID=669 RepID=UPI000C79599C|nr:non-ribosomal peptide synthetase [Vibrio harveyi]AWA98062.1 amino acid adenylation domain-containing protein [Vibrio harveyi]